MKGKLGSREEPENVADMLVWGDRVARRVKNHIALDRVV